MVSVSGSSGTVNVLSGSSNVTVVQIHLNNSSNMAVTLTQLNLAGSGGNPSGITSVSVLINDAPAGSPTAFSGNPVNVNLNNYVFTPRVANSAGPGELFRFGEWNLPAVDQQHGGKQRQLFDGRRIP